MIVLIALSLLFFLYRILKDQNLFLVLPIYYLIICVYFLFGTSLFSYAIESPFSSGGVHSKNVSRGLTVFLIAAWSFFLGVSVSGSQKLKKQMSMSSVNFWLSRCPPWLILAFYLFCITSLHIGLSVSHLYSREGYTIGSNAGSGFRTLFVLTLPIVSLLLPFFPLKIVRMGLLLILLLLVQGANSRSLLLVPFFYFVGSSIKYMRWSYYKFLLTVTSILLFSAYVLQYRYNEIQGVFPNIIYLFNHGIDFSYVMVGLNYLLSFSFYSTEFTLSQGVLDWKAFYLSLNPLPSRFLDINYMVDSQKLTEHAPFSALGTLALAGNLFVFGYYFIAGFLWKRLVTFIFSKSGALGVLSIILFALFCVLSVQYNLRGITRLLYYLIFIFIVLKTLFFMSSISKMSKQFGNDS